MLKQPQYSPMPMEEQVISIFAATPQEGRPSWVRNYAIEDLQRYEREVLEFMRNRHGDVLEAIRKTGKLEDDVERKLAAASEQQSAASEEINRSIEDVNVISNETADAMSQAAQAAMELAKQSQELKSLIEDMTGGDSGQTTRAPAALKSVITSYSIHYTKLYEMTTSIVGSS